MLKTIIGLFALLFLLPLQAQYIDLQVCNEIKSIQERNNCLTASLENLITKDLEKNMEMLRLQPGDSVSLKLEVAVSGVGNFGISSIQTPSFAVARSVNAAITAIKPLEIYKDETGEIVRSHLSIETVFTTDKYGGLVSLSKSIAESTPVDPDREVDEIDEVPFAVIESVPVFPGCIYGRTNKERKDCMSLAIQIHVSRNFDPSLADRLDLNPGKVRISVQFVINKDGFVTHVIARAPHPFLEDEAIRVISSLPKMTPGTHRGKNVGVLYSLPITFIIDDYKQKKKRKG